jgi:putative nucleotidyltransferase with HDIG domain
MVWSTVDISVAPPVQRIIDMAIMVLLFILCRVLPIAIAEDKYIDVSFAPVVASAMIFGLYPTILLFFISGFFLFAQDEVSGRYYYPLSKAPKKELFNTTNILLSIFVGGQFLPLIGGWGPDFTFPYSMFPAVVFGTATLATNLLLFICYFVSSGEQNFVRMFSQTVLGILPNIFSTIPFGIFIALLLHQENGSYYVLLFILPLLLARYSFKLYLESRSVHLRTIEALSKAIEAKDRYTRGHSQRVAQLSEQLAQALHMTGREVGDIKVAALLHDIGKIGIEDNILNKPGSLTHDEFEEIKKHPAIGMDIIKDIRLSKTVNDAVLYHHFCYDLTGYPVEAVPILELPLAAAILGIADAFDAMTTDRPYRAALAITEARLNLVNGRGTQFDPEAVDALIELLDEEIVTIESEPEVA